jgi:hypothetical protein
MDVVDENAVEQRGELDGIYTLAAQADDTQLDGDLRLPSIARPSRHIDNVHLERGPKTKDVGVGTEFDDGNQSYLVRGQETPRVKQTRGAPVGDKESVRPMFPIL